MNNSIVDEVRAVREKLAARFNYDIKAICAHARKSEAKYKNRLVSFAPKKRRTLKVAA